MNKLKISALQQLFKRSSSLYTFVNMGKKKAPDTKPIQIEQNPKKFTFKNSNFESKRTLKNLKQILQHESSLKWDKESTDYLYTSIDAFPSSLPPKKYSDLSGLPAPYTDPHTKLRFSSVDEYSRLKNLSTDIITGLLALRKSSPLFS